MGGSKTSKINLSTKHISMKPYIILILITILLSQCKPKSDNLIILNETGFFVLQTDEENKTKFVYNGDTFLIKNVSAGKLKDMQSLHLTQAAKEENTYYILLNTAPINSVSEENINLLNKENAKTGIKSKKDSLDDFISRFNDCTC